MVRNIDELSDLEKLALIPISYSRLSTFEKCPAAYFYTYCLMEPQQFGPAASLGSIIHEALEKNDYDEPLTVENINRLFEEYRPKHDPDNLIDNRLLAAKDEMIVDFVSRHEDEEFNIVGKEVPFAIVVGQALIVGFIDRVDRLADDYLHIIDYKCLTLDTKVQMSDGSQKSAKDINIGDRVIGYENGMHVPVDVIDVIDNGLQPIAHIETEQGRELTVTWNHPVLTDSGWIMASNLKPGYKIVSEISLNYDWWEGKATITPLDSYLLGAMCGDGSTIKGLKFTNQDQEVVSKVNEALSFHNAKLSCYDPARLYEYDITQIDASAKRINRASIIRDFFRTHKLEGCNFSSKRAPQAVMTGGPEVWKEFLTGIFDTDGHVRTNPAYNIVINMTNKELLKDCQHLLSYFGIKSYVTEIKATYKDKPYQTWRLKITDSFGIKLFTDLIQSNVSYKNEALLNARQVTAKGYDLVYTPNYGYDVVKSISSMNKKAKNGLQPTIALTVSGNHTHVTEGIVTHNSGSFEVTNKAAPDNLQLGIYALAMSHMYPNHKIRADLYYLRTGRMKGAEFAPAKLLEVEDRLVGLVNELVDCQNFGFTPDKFSCKWCDHCVSGACSVGAKRWPQLVKPRD